MLDVSVFGLRWCGWGLELGSRMVDWCHVCVSCDSGLFVWMASPGICILCQEDTCAS